MLYVTHDLGLLSQIADRVGVMYAGRMVEIAPTADLFSDPKHPYTRGLIGSIPRIEDRSGLPARPLRGLLQRHELPQGCPFAPRCDWALPRCFEERQELAAGRSPSARSPAGAGRRYRCPADARAIVAFGGSSEARAAACDSTDVSVVYGCGHKHAFAALRDITLRHHAKARRSRWWANPAAENRRSRARSPG